MPAEFTIVHTDNTVSAAWGHRALSGKDPCGESGCPWLKRILWLVSKNAISDVADGRLGMVLIEVGSRISGLQRKACFRSSGASFSIWLGPRPCRVGLCRSSGGAENRQLLRNQVEETGSLKRAPESEGRTAFRLGCRPNSDPHLPCGRALSLVIAACLPTHDNADLCQPLRRPPSSAESKTFIESRTSAAKRVGPASTALAQLHVLSNSRPGRR